MHSALCGQQQALLQRQRGAAQADVARRAWLATPATPPSHHRQQQQQQRRQQTPDRHVATLSSSAGAAAFPPDAGEPPSGQAQQGQPVSMWQRIKRFFVGACG
jgi:hypothetical protein